MEAPAPRKDLWMLAQLFTRLGLTAFGGPAAHTAMMHREFVLRRAWLTEQQFLDLAGATQLIPGPNSTELAMHIGQERAGWRGLLVAGCCFIAPAVAITLGLAVLHERYGGLPAAGPILMGVQAALLPVVALALWPMAKQAASAAWQVLLGLLALVAALWGQHELLVMLAAGAVGAVVQGGWRRPPMGSQWLPLTLLGGGAAGTGPMAIFLSFLKIGAILYGSGYVLFAFIDAELVATGQLARQDLVDAIAAGQMTPGPVFSAVTFVGYRMQGMAGAAAATIGVFLPAFIFVALLRPITRWMRGNRWFAGFLAGVNIATVALVAVVCGEMAMPLLPEPSAALIAWWSLLAQLAFPKVNSVWVILGGAAAGALLGIWA